MSWRSHKARSETASDDTLRSQELLQALLDLQGPLVAQRITSLLLMSAIWANTVYALTIPSRCWGVMIPCGLSTDTTSHDWTDKSLQGRQVFEERQVSAFHAAATSLCF